MILVEATGLWKMYGRGRRRRVALCDVGFRVQAGEVVGVVGPNGAGKTTLLHLLAGERAPTRGALHVAGHRAGTRAAREAVGFAPDPPLVPPELTGVEWLTYLASHRATSAADRLRRVRAAIELGELDDFAGRRTAQYSRGMGQRLGLAGALAAGTRVLVLDEALNGIDPLVHRRIRERLTAVAAEGRAVLVASHDLATVERLATRVLVLREGRLVADVTMSRLVTERVVELALPSADGAGVAWLLERFPGAVRTGDGVAVPLTAGATAEAVLAACRERRLPVGGSRVRYRALEDILVEAEAGGRVEPGG